MAETDVQFLIRNRNITTVTNGLYFFIGIEVGRTVLWIDFLCFHLSLFSVCCLIPSFCKNDYWMGEPEMTEFMIIVIQWKISVFHSMNWFISIVMLTLPACGFISLIFKCPFRSPFIFCFRSLFRRSLKFIPSWRLRRAIKFASGKQTSIRQYNKVWLPPPPSRQKS